MLFNTNNAVKLPKILVPAEPDEAEAWFKTMAENPNDLLIETAHRAKSPDYVVVVPPEYEEQFKALFAAVNAQQDPFEYKDGTAQLGPYLMVQQPTGVNVLLFGRIPLKFVDGDNAWDRAKHLVLELQDKDVRVRGNKPTTESLNLMDQILAS